MAVNSCGGGGNTGMGGGGGGGRGCPRRDGRSRRPRRRSGSRQRDRRRVLRAADQEEYQYRPQENEIPPSLHHGVVLPWPFGGATSLPIPSQAQVGPRPRKNEGQQPLSALRSSDRKPEHCQ